MGTMTAGVMAGQRATRGQAAVVAGFSAAIRTAVVVSVDPGLRQRLGVALSALRWQVVEAGGGAEAMAKLEAMQPEALLVDSWLPDLEVGEFLEQAALLYPAMDLLRVDGGIEAGGRRSARRHELLHALREATEGGDTGRGGVRAGGAAAANPVSLPSPANLRVPHIVTSRGKAALAGPTRPVEDTEVEAAAQEIMELLPDMIGGSEPMRELAGLIRLVAPRSSTVLIEGETGTGKEVVARAVHRLSERAGTSFTVLNCAAIPEALLEAELFGHTRGAFTGAVQSRTGRIEAAHGGTLFLDEIGEMPLALQAKILRFLDCGELQRVGDNEVMRVDVRVIAATHQPLEEMAAEGTFRLDLYHRLAVFPMEVAPLRERMEDIEMLAEHFLEQMGRERPRKRLTRGAIVMLKSHRWPGNVRELQRVLERGSILAGDRAEIGEDEIRLRRATRGSGEKDRAMQASLTFPGRK